MSVRRERPARRLALLPAALLLAATWTADTADAQQNRVTLTVKPVLCITDKRDESCAITVMVIWRAEEPGNFCLYSELRSDAIRCWSGASTGMVAEDVTVRETFRYWLANGATAPPLAEATFDVMTTESDDRRRNRRRRHVWDIL